MKKVRFLFGLIIFLNFNAVSQENTAGQTGLILKRYDSLIMSIDSKPDLKERNVQGRSRSLKTFQGTILLSEDKNLIKKAIFFFRELPLDYYTTYLNDGKIICVFSGGLKMYYVNSKCFVREGCRIIPYIEGADILQEFEEIIANISVLFND